MLARKSSIWPGVKLNSHCHLYECSGAASLKTGSGVAAFWPQLGFKSDGHVARVRRWNEQGRRRAHGLGRQVDIWVTGRERLGRWSFFFSLMISQLVPACPPPRTHPSLLHSGEPPYNPPLT